MIRLTIPSIEEEDIQSISQVLRTGQLVQGKCVAEFEALLAEYVGVAHAIAVSNCTAALHLALLAVNTRPGDIVIVTSYSWVATANVIELCGAQPRFVDIDPNSFNMDPNCLETILKQLMSKRDTARRVKAILPVHTFGQMADMPSIQDVASRYGNLPVIEDAACALGAKLNDKQAGTWGAMGCFSFHPRKAITTGEGGVITTNDIQLANFIKALRNHGQDPTAPISDFIMPGFNYRLTEFQAALGCTQMSKLDRIINARRQKAARYNELLQTTPLQPPLEIHKGNYHVYQSYVILLPAEAAIRRMKIIESLGKQGIQVTIGTYHIPMTTYYRSRYNFRPGDFPVADALFARALTLPLHEYLSEEEQSRVVQALISEVEGG